MSKDLFLKGTKRNWARGAAEAPAAPAATPADQAKAKIAELDAVKKAADAGDPKARKKWKKISKNIVKLRKKALKGDAKSRMALAMLGPYGLLASAAIKGDDTKQVEILGDDAMGRAEILGDGSCGDDEIMAALEGGSSEQEALIRSLGWNPFKSAYRGVRKGARGLGRGARKFGRGLRTASLTSLKALSEMRPPGGSLMVGDDESGAWLHKMNPLYWLKSKEERQFIDAERERWILNAKLRKKLAKREKTLQQAERAKAATQSVEEARAQAAAMDEQLRSLQAALQISGIGYNTHLAYVQGDGDENEKTMKKIAVAEIRLLARAKKGDESAREILPIVQECKKAMLRLMHQPAKL